MAVNSESSLNQWLRRAMIAAGLDPTSRGGGRAELARRAGVPQPTIKRMLDDPKVTPTLENLRRVGTALGYKLGDVLVQAGLATPDELANESADLPHLDPGEQRIMEHPGLDDQTRYAMLKSYRRVRDEQIAFVLASLDIETAQEHSPRATS